MQENDNEFSPVAPKRFEGLKSALAQASRAFRKETPRPAYRKPEKDEPLALPITLEGSKSQQRKLTKIVNAMCESEAGCTILEAAMEAGYALRFDKSTVQEGIFGYADPCNMECVLNPQNSTEEAIVTLAHELRHAYQFESPVIDSITTAKVDTKTKIITDRAMEADAESYGCIVAWELKEAGRPQTWNDFKGEFPEVAEPFETVYETTKDLKRARTAAFKGWYDNESRRDSYDQTHLEELEGIAPNNMSKKLKSVPAEKIVKAICHDPQKSSYFTESPDILESGKYLTVYSDTKKKLQKFFAERNTMVGRVPDTTVDNLPTIPRPKSKKKGKLVSKRAKPLYTIRAGSQARKDEKTSLEDRQAKAARIIQDKKKEKAVTTILNATKKGLSR